MSDPYRCRDGPASGCRQCGKTPTGRRTVYCSDDCRRRFEYRHAWPLARHAASYEDFEGYVEYVLDRRPKAPPLRDCVDCGGNPMEVHHVRPLPHRAGRTAHYTFTCDNHPENLVPLCLACHGRRHQDLNAAKKRGAEPVRQLEISI